MNPLLRSFFTALAGLAACVAFAQSPGTVSPPHLERRGLAQQLIVDDKPYLVLGGELHNSSSTNRDYMRPIWPKLAEMNLNTVLAAVPWDMVEPTEGKFDFRMVDELLQDARTHQLRLVLLWFGSWKNGLSHYAPAWVKSDTARFPRAETRSGALEILSTFGNNTRAADARAFAALMRHLREVDGAQRTVIMMQVENEVGLHTDARDRSDGANQAWNATVPQALLDTLTAKRESLLPEFRQLWQRQGYRTKGTWAEVFGTDAAAEEVFSAWHYATFVDAVTAAGKNEYNLPCFVNAWIVQPEDETPGDYPAGGPQAHVLDLWRAGAPHVDLLCPDIYLPNFTDVCAQFTRAGNTLFVPEARAGLEGAANALTAIGRFSALGYSPFGIESRETAGEGPISRMYAALRPMSALILDAQRDGKIGAASVSTQDKTQDLRLGNYRMQAALRSPPRGSADAPERGCALVIQLGADEFLVLGSDVEITFATDPSSDRTVGLASVEEGAFKDGQWIRGRVLNGDEIMLSYDFRKAAPNRQTGTGLKFIGTTPSLQRVKLYRY